MTTRNGATPTTNGMTAAANSIKPTTNTEKHALGGTCLRMRRHPRHTSDLKKEGAAR